jgi:drug/metabolite transporter (DMT)-like permease
MVAATALWGATFVIIRDALDQVAPLWLVAARFLGAALLLGVALWLARLRPDRATLRGGVISGALCAGAYVCQCIGLQSVHAGTSAFLTSAGSLAAAFLAWPFLGQRPSPRLILSVALAAAGSLLLSDTALGFGPGERWTLAGSLLFGAQIVALGRFAPAAHPLALTFVQTATVAVLTLPGLAFSSAPSLTTSTALRIGYLMLAGSLAAPLLQIHAQRVLPPGRVGVLFTMEPMFAVAFAVGLGGEIYAGRWWIGAALILLAVVLVESAAFERSRASGAAAQDLEKRPFEP